MPSASHPNVLAMCRELPPMPHPTSSIVRIFEPSTSAHFRASSIMSTCARAWSSRSHPFG